MHFPAKSRAVLLDDFGTADRLRLAEVPTPLPRPDEILVRLAATSVNPIEWKARQGLGLPRWLWRRVLGKPMILGFDFSGTVVAVGAEVEDYQPGDSVMGAMPMRGAYAEYLVIRPSDPHVAIAAKPANVPHEAAAVLPFAGLVAYAGLVSHGGLDPHAPRARILIVGASGGVGHLAVQMARHGLGASYVVGVCSSRNEQFVRACGAHTIVPHDKVTVEDIPALHPEWARSFDLIFDAVGIDAYYTRVAALLLKPGGRFVTAALPQMEDGRPGEDRSPFAALVLLFRTLWRQATGRYRLIGGLIGELPSKTGFPVMVGWLARGKIKPHISARYDLAHMADAHRASETGRTIGKIAVAIAAG